MKGFPDQQRSGIHDCRQSPDKLRGGPEVDRHGDDPFENASPKGHHPLGPVLSPEKNAFALRDTGSAQSSASKRWDRGLGPPLRTSGALLQGPLHNEEIAAMAPPDFEERRERGRIADHLLDSSIGIFTGLSAETKLHERGTNNYYGNTSR